MPQPELETKEQSAPNERKDEVASKHMLDEVHDSIAANDVRSHGVTGIGGVFIRSDDPKALGDWYKENLGMDLNKFGMVILKWPEDKGVDGGKTVVKAFEKDAPKFGDSKSNIMIDFRVDNLDEVRKRLQKDPKNIIEEEEPAEFGKFLMVTDPDGNKIELWEPIQKDAPEKK